MLAICDVDYPPAGGARAACVLAEGWTSAAAARDRTVVLERVVPYEPGHFAARELPCLLAVLEGLSFDLVICDAQVWLGPDRRGLGARLHQALGCPVVGVAKTRFVGAPVIEVRRGGSQSPLLVSAIGLAGEAAAEHVRAMHGPFRVPTLIRRADQLARGLIPGS